MPKANSEFWREKFEGNMRRDELARSALAKRGWQIRTVWEHELRADLHGTALMIATEIALMRSGA